VINGICPSCGSATVHRGEVHVGNGRILLRLTYRHRVKTADFLCVTCGYFEKHIVPGKTLAKAAARWPLVLPPTDTPPAPYSSS
jgi:hypothetical protein